MGRKYVTDSEEASNPAIGTFSHVGDTQISQPYTIFTPTQKSLLLYACSISAIFSTVSYFIYFPAITAIAKDLGVSIQSVNFTITFYQIISSIAPSIFGSMADEIGRRSILLLTSALYLGANIGLALTNRYVVLVVLRCLQSAGASCSIAIAYGIIADIAAPDERGSFVGVLLGFTNAAPSLGPIIGGVVSEKLSWRWIFWLMAITSSTHLVLLIIFLPETCKNLVENSSLNPGHALNRPVYAILSQRHSHCANFIVILVGGVTYTVSGCLAAALSAQVIQVYSLNYLTAGLTYLPAGIGGMFAAYLTGKMLDYDFRVITRKLEISSELSSAPRADFLTGKARLRSVFPAIIVSSITTVGHGWTLHTKRHIAVLLIVQFFSGAAQVFVFVTCGTSLIELNQGKSSTAQVSYNLIRCTLSAAGIAALDAMIRGLGVGWCFSILGIFEATYVQLLYLLKRNGEGWRARKREESGD